MAHLLEFSAAVVAAAIFLRFTRKTAPIAAAYKAKVLCSALFVSGLKLDPDRAEEVSADAYRLMRLFRARVDEAARSVTVSFFGLSGRTATFRPGLGATLSVLDAPQALMTRPGDAGQGARETRVSVRGLDGGRTRPAHADLERVVEAAFTEPNPARLRRTRAIVILKDGELIAERYGPGITPETPLPGWSMAKSAIGALIGILVREGRLSLDQRELWPDWRRPDPRAEISLEDLLRMRSGLAFSESYADVDSDVVKMLFTSADAAGYAASRPLACQPGAVWKYASGTTNILSGIIRRVVGDAEYLDWPRKVLFAPLGMSTAVLEPDASGTFVGSSFLFACARDWARLGELHRLDGVWDGRRVLPEGWVRRVTTPTPQSPGGIYGAHWWLGLVKESGGETPFAERVPKDAYFAMGHEGQALTVIPSQGLVAVRLGLSIYIDAWNQAKFLADVLDALR